VHLRDIFDRQEFPWTARPEHVRARVDLLRRSLPEHDRPLRLLDLGCGAGENTLLVTEALGCCRAVGVDWAPRPLAVAHTQGLPVVQAVLDGADLPFPEASFDVVVLSEVIEHLVDPDHTVDEARRVLRPGGTFLVTTPNLAAWFNRLLLAAGVQPVFSEVSSRKVYGRPGTEVVGHLRLFTRRALVELLHDAGFVDVRLAGVSFHGVPAPLRPLDRVMARWPEVAATLLAAAVKPRPARLRVVSP
jgi:SAM-dependent methyltransferase